MALKFAAAPEAAPTINVVLIGPPKTGKTTGAASAPGPVLYLNADLPNATRFARRRHPGVEEVVLEGLQTLTDITHEVGSPGTDFKTVVIDPVGELYRRLLEERSDRAIRPRIDNYSDISVLIGRFFEAMCKAPVNAVFIAHDLPIVEEATGEGIVLPFMGTTGKGGVALGRRLLGMVDVIGFTGVTYDDGGSAQYVAQLTAAKGRPAGGRFECLAGDTGFRETNLSEWIDLIAAAEATATDGATDNDNSKGK